MSEPNSKIESSEKKSKREDLRAIILSSVHVAGIVSIGLIAPNALQAMKKFGLTPKPRQIESIKTSQDRLIEKGYLILKNGNVSISEKGKIYLSSKITKKERRKWDRKWRILIFDIPESLRYARNQLRLALQNFGFYKLQDSVWIYPHNCEDLVSLLKADLEMGKEVIYIIANTVEGDEELKKHFNI